MHHIQTRYNILHILFWMISCCINGFVAIYLKSKGLDNTLIGIVTGASCILITLIITIPFVMFGLFRYWFIVETLKGGESPTDVIVQDWQILLTVALWIGCCIWALVPA